MGEGEVVGDDVGASLEGGGCAPIGEGESSGLVVGEGDGRGVVVVEEDDEGEGLNVGDAFG